MKTLDPLSKKILVISFSFSLILCSCSLLIWSATSAHATPVKSFMAPPTPAINGEEFIPCGIVNGYAYWAVIGESGYKFRKSSISGSHWVSRTN